MKWVALIYVIILGLFAALCLLTRVIDRAIARDEARHRETFPFTTPCPVCGFLTLRRSRLGCPAYSVCAVCFWEDDDWFEGGGANDVSLKEARVNYTTIGACDPRVLSHVRSPRADELLAA